MGPELNLVVGIVFADEVIEDRFAIGEGDTMGAGALPVIGVLEAVVSDGIDKIRVWRDAWTGMRFPSSRI